MLDGLIKFSLSHRPWVVSAAAPVFATHRNNHDRVFRTASESGADHLHSFVREHKHDTLN